MAAFPTAKNWKHIYTQMVPLCSLQSVNRGLLIVLLVNSPWSWASFTSLILCLYDTSQPTESHPSNRRPSTDIYIQTHSEPSENASSHLVLLSPLPAQLSVGCRHRLNHKSGGHVAAGGHETGLKCLEWLYRRQNISYWEFCSWATKAKLENV